MTDTTHVVECAGYYSYRYVRLLLSWANWTDIRYNSSCCIQDDNGPRSMDIFIISFFSFFGGSCADPIWLLAPPLASTYTQGVSELFTTFFWNISIYVFLYILSCLPISS